MGFEWIVTSEFVEVLMHRELAGHVLFIAQTTNWILVKGEPELKEPFLTNTYFIISSSLSYAF